MADTALDEAIKKSIESENVDDILSGILNADGSFNNEYNGLFARYLGVETDAVSSASSDLSDRSFDAAFQNAYENDELSDEFGYTRDSAIAEKMGENGDVYQRQITMEKRPSFTIDGDVNYPRVGSGESEERVVYDSDWETKAKLESERAKNYAQRSPYSAAYGRRFVAGGQELSRESYRPVIEQSESPFVDPISEDDDFERYWAKQYEMRGKKSFFQDGLRENPVKNKTVISEDRNDKDSVSETDEKTYSSDWLKVDKKDHRRKKRGDRSAIPDRRPLPKISDVNKLTSSAVISDKNPISRKTYISAAEKKAKIVELEAMELRTTVAEIVDKYDKKTEEEKLERLREEKIKAEAEKAAAQKAALERAKKAKERMGVSETVCDALDAEENSSPDVYDDFTPMTEEDFDDIG